MDIKLYLTTSEKMRIQKTLTSERTYSGHLRDATSVTNPVFRIEIDNPISYNYAYIPAFGRYYYISDMVSIRNGLWELHLTCDVLMSFASYIRGARIVLDRTEDTGQETYIPGDTWLATAKAKTDIIAFPDGLNSSGEYILITSGGIGGI